MVDSVIIPVTVLFTVIETVLCEYYYSQNLGQGTFAVKRGKVPENDEWLARAYMVDKGLKRTGWGYLEIETSSNNADMVQAYQAGYLEGIICSDLIYNYWEKNIINSKLAEQIYYPDLIKFIELNTEWILNGVKNTQKFPTWLHLCLLYKQIEGLYHAMKQSKPHANITYYDLILLHALDELPEILTGLELKTPTFGMDFGTVIIKRIQERNTSNTLILHSKPYVDNIRFQKKYILPYNTASAGQDYKLQSKTMMFTSPPGMVTAEDGFYLASSNLVVTRTAIDTAYRVKIHSSYAVHLGFPRAYIATRIANTTRQWFSELCTFAGSTYNSEYIVVNFNRLKQEDSQNLPDAALYAYDIPGSRKHFSAGHDLACGKSLFSTNVPKSSSIYHVTNQQKNALHFGILYSYSSSPRLLKLQVYQDSITNLDDLLRVGQFNMTTDLLPGTNGTISTHFYPKTIVYTKLMNSRLHDMFNFAIVGYPNKEPITTYGEDGETTFEAEAEKGRRESAS